MATVGKTTDRMPPQKLQQDIDQWKRHRRKGRVTFSSILFLALPFLLCLFHWSISAVVSGGHFICCFSTVATFLTRREPGVPLSLFRSYPLPFPCPFVSIMFLSLPFLLCLYSLIYTCCSFRRHSICCFPCCSHMFLTRREPGVPLSLFRSYPLPFSPPFLLYCSLPFPFFYAFFIDPYLL